MSDDKIDQAVFKIFRMTHEDELNWESKLVPRLWSQGTDTVYPIYFETELEGRKLALFQKRKRTNASSKQLMGVIGEATSDWALYTRLALLGDNDEIMFEFPPSRQVKALLDAVRYKKANVEGFLDAVLKTESA